MKYIKSIILIIIVLATSGCWNYRELSEVAIVSAIGIDTKDDKFNISVQVVNTKVVASGANGGGTSNESPTVIYSSEGRTIKEAIQNMVFEAPNVLYLGHLHLLVISENVAKEGIYEIIDYFMSDVEIRKIFPVVVVKNATAKDTIKIVTPFETVNASNVKEALTSTASINGTVSNRQFDEILACLYTEGRHPTISAVEIIGSPEEGQSTDNIKESDSDTEIKLTGSAILKSDKLVGYLDGLDSLGYTILRDMVKTMNITFPCDKKGNYGTVVIDNVKTEIKVKIKDKKPSADIVVTGRAAIPEYNCKIDLKDPIKAIEKNDKMVNKEIKKILGNTMKKLQLELKSDVIGFGEKIYREKNKEWKKIKKDWDNTFTTMSYKINSKVKIKSVESTVKPAKEGQ